MKNSALKHIQEMLRSALAHAEIAMSVAREQHETAERVWATNERYNVFVVEDAFAEVEYAADVTKQAVRVLEHAISSLEQAINALED